MKTFPCTNLLSLRLSPSSSITDISTCSKTCKLHCPPPTIGNCHHSSKHIMAYRICIGQNRRPAVGLPIRAGKRHANALLGLICTLINIVPPQRKRILSNPHVEFVSFCHPDHTSGSITAIYSSDSDSSSASKSIKSAKMSTPSPKMADPKVRQLVFSDTIPSQRGSTAEEGP